MGQYANIASRRMYRFLRWLGNHKAIDVMVAGRHPTKVTCRKNGESYPLPASHREVNKYIVEDFMQWLVKNEICTEQEFDEKI